MSDLLDFKELKTYNKIIAGLYETSDIEKSIAFFFDRLQELVHFDKGDLCIFTYKDGERICDLFIPSGWSNAEITDYLSKYYALDDTVPILSNNEPLMFRSSDVFLDEFREESEYMHDFLIPARVKYSIEGNLSVNEYGTMIGLAIHRSDKYGDFTDKELSILKLFREHLAQVSNHYMKNSDNRTIYTTVMPLLANSEQIGFFIWDADLKLIGTNFEDKDSFSSEQYNCLLLLCRNLRKHMKQGTEVRSTKGLIPSDAKSYFAEINYTGAQEKGSGYFIGIVYDYYKLLIDMLREIKDKYSLTNREFDVLECVIKGMGNDEIAKKLVISMPTVKKHLYNIYQKLEITGKHQILSLLFK